MSNVSLSFETNAEKFYPVFYEYILDTFSWRSRQHASLLLGFKLTDYVLSYLADRSYGNNSVAQFKYSSEDLNDKETLIMFYVAGYVFFCILL